MQDIVHVPCPDQFCLSIDYKPRKITATALVQARVDAQLFRALVRLVKIDLPVVKDLEWGRRLGSLGIAVVTSFIAAEVRE